MIDGLADLGEMILHGYGVAIGKHKAGTFALLRADRAAAENRWSELKIGARSETINLSDDEWEAKRLRKSARAWESSGREWA